MDHALRVFLCGLALLVPCASIKAATMREPQLTTSPRYDKHIATTRGVVESWPVSPRRPADTDRIAVTILQPVNETTLQLFNYVIRATMHRLGPEWALQIFYGTDDDREQMSALLGREDASRILWSPIKLEGKPYANVTLKEANWFRLSMDFWGQIPENCEHVLIFEGDSLLLQGPGCVERFFDYKYVGAPWNRSIPWGRQTAPHEGGNGGLSLHSRKASVEVVNSEGNKKNRDFLCGNRHCQGPKRRFPQHEDGEMVAIMKQSGGGFDNGAFPPRETAMEFAVEQLYHEKPCGFHKPWEFISEAQASDLLASMDLS